MTTADGGDPLARLRARVGGIPDPEIPVVTLADLGILRDVSLVDGRPHVVLTPTYSGCPATEAIAAEVRDVLRADGHADARVTLQLAPAWTTDWISDDGRRKLRAYGIAPPGRCADGVAATGPTTRVVQFHPRGAGAAPPVDGGPACPRCESPDVEELSRHGSTPCKALYRCRRCREPFDYFKPY